MKVPKARKKTTCMAGKVLRSLAMRFITEKDKVANSMNAMPLVIILNSKTKNWKRGHIYDCFLESGC